MVNATSGSELPTDYQSHQEQSFGMGVRECKDEDDQLLWPPRYLTSPLVSLPRLRKVSFDGH